MEELYFRHRRAEVAVFLPTKFHRVLEIGCGAGFFRTNIDGAMPVEYWGVELSESAATEAGTRLDKVLVGDFLSNLPRLPDAYFDLVVCNDVIEHMSSHDEFLEQVKQKMVPKACLVGSVPNVRYIENLVEVLVRKDWQYQDAGILDRTHLRFFTEKSLARSFTEHGYNIDVLAGINRMPYSRQLPKKLVQKAAVLLAGPDSRYPQIGFRVSLS